MSKRRHKPRDYRSARNAARRHALGLGGTFGFLMLLFVTLSTHINPLWLTPTAWTDSSYADYKPVHKFPRNGKTGLIRSFDWDTVLLGSSRVDIAFDPLLPEWDGKRVANLALRGGTLNEHLAMLEYASENEQLELAIIGVDLTDLTNPVTIPPGAGFEESPLSDTGDAFEKELRYRCGYSFFEMSVKTLNYKIRDRLSAYTPEGHWLRQLDKRPLRAVLQYVSFMWSDRYITQRKKSIEINPAKVEALRSIIQLCQKKNIRLILCIPPNHAAFLSVFRLKHDPDPGFRIDREVICQVVAEENAKGSGAPVELWDFNDFHPYNCEALPPIDDPRKPSEYWADGTHALPSLGKIMLARMLDWPLEDPAHASYGRKLESGDVEARLDEITAGYERYQNDHPDDHQWVIDHMDLWEKN
ncbi:hypothetical protein [Haloferula sp.]|uniref:hypothetical protein n=1 Tax=Haloferula sp. TaxID=2497595 RepID=UPI003C760061